MFFCRRRAMKKSSVAGVVNENGELVRVVVTQRQNMKYHAGEGEQIFVLPNVRVQEPVPWHRVADLIDIVRQFVAKKTGAA